MEKYLLFGNIFVCIVTSDRGAANVKNP